MIHSQTTNFEGLFDSKKDAQKQELSLNRQSTIVSQPIHDLSVSPFTIKYDFNAKNTVKNLSITADQKIALFNITRQIYFMDIKDILRTKEKLKGNKINYLPTRIDFNEQSIVECNPILSNVAATISN
jgi:uncharacterized protein (DUF488 family)